MLKTTCAEYKRGVSSSYRDTSEIIIMAGPNISDSDLHELIDFYSNRNAAIFGDVRERIGEEIDKERRRIALLMSSCKSLRRDQQEICPAKQPPHIRQVNILSVRLPSLDVQPKNTKDGKGKRKGKKSPTEFSSSDAARIPRQSSTRKKDKKEGTKHQSGSSLKVKTNHLMPPSKDEERTLKSPRRNAICEFSSDPHQERTQARVFIKRFGREYDSENEETIFVEQPKPSSSWRKFLVSRSDGFVQEKTKYFAIK